MLTIKDKILADLQRGDRLSGLDGMIRYNTLALRNRISELRAENYDIQDEMIHQNGKAFKVYFIPKEQQLTF